MFGNDLRKKTITIDMTKRATEPKKQWKQPSPKQQQKKAKAADIYGKDEMFSFNYLKQKVEEKAEVVFPSISGGLSTGIMIAFTRHHYVVETTEGMTLHLCRSKTIGFKTKEEVKNV